MLIPLRDVSVEVVVLAKPGCHLCEAVEAELRSIRSIAPRLTVVNIELNRSLYERYLLRIPIVIVGGKVLFEGRMMDPEGEWRGRLEQLLSIQP